MSLPRDQKQEEENPGSHDHDLHSPKGYAARHVLRHRQLRLSGRRARRPSDVAKTCSQRRELLMKDTLYGDHRTVGLPAVQSVKIPISGADLGGAR